MNKEDYIGPRNNSYKYPCAICHQNNVTFSIKIVNNSRLFNKTMMELFREYTEWPWIDFCSEECFNFFLLSN